MFGRDKHSTPPATSATPVTAPVRATTKEGGKGRPTPTRKEAEARNRRPLIGPPPPAPGATKAERKAQRAARAEAVRKERAISRQGLASGDERFLPARDKGPARRLTRDYVDARRNLGEFFLPVALTSTLVSLVNIEIVRILAPIALYALIIGIIVDSYLLQRRVKTMVDERFGATAAAGTGWYAVLRALQWRRMRVPKPVVARGAFPR